ncbi:MAG: reverse transcriptase N-terminal domain-containing protein [Cyanobacteria bacterium REEB67]|nr:reverse transcriptase N-terminal domain-containing protein [Cyanobacteria bacterium REEB67]
MAEDRVLKDIGTKELKDWHDINWRASRKRVKNLRRRIFRATQNKQWNQVTSGNIVVCAW